jgi:photosystem II stability/assembly factor-like uncharacterized protein
VGENGVILGTRDAGETWTTVQPSVAVQPLRSVSRASVRHAVAVGDLGNAPYSVESGDSALWVVNNVGGTNNLRGVSFPTEDVGYAVGSNVNGVILRSIDGGLTWQSQTPNTASQLNAVFFINENRGWAVGNNGVILRTASGGAATSSFAHRAAQRAVRRR